MAPDILIRRFEKSDANDVSRLIIDNLMLVNIIDYGAEAVEQLARFYTPQYVLEYAQRGEVYVALEDSCIIGTVALDRDRVRNVFVRMNHHRQGIGKRLMRYIEGVACREGKPRLFLRANFAAVDFYKNLGYGTVEEKEESIGSAQVKIVVMEKMLLPVSD